jgi:hypothetical protein
MEDTHEAELRAHYELGEERDRLAAGHGVLEFIRTTEIVLRYLPSAPARVADIGGGPGRYALWLAELGYEVEHRDLMPLHVRQVEDDAAARGEVRDAGLAVVDLVSVEGPASLLGDLAERLDDLVARAVVLDSARAAERVPELLGIGPHLLATGVR